MKKYAFTLAEALITIVVLGSLYTSLLNISTSAAFANNNDLILQSDLSEEGACPSCGWCGG